MAGKPKPYLRGQGSLVREQLFSGKKIDSPIIYEPLAKTELGTVGAAIQMLQKVDPTLPLYFDCPDCGKGHLIKTIRYSVVVETEPKK